MNHHKSENRTHHPVRSVYGDQSASDRIDEPCNPFKFRVLNNQTCSGRIGMGIADRRQREKEQRKTGIIDAAERLFFSRSYEDVSMEDIAHEVELNKATIYLYFKNKETLFATIVLRGIRILKEKYTECMEKKVPGIVKVALMGQAYYQFSQEYPDYLRLIHFYGSERFSKENPYTAEIGKGYGTCRMILRDAIQEGIDDGTIRA